MPSTDDPPRKPTLIGYARVSTTDQSLDLQLDALKDAGCERVFKEKRSATKTQLPTLAVCLDTLEAGDVLVVWKLDRLGRSLKDLVQKIHKLDEANVGFRSLREQIDTTTPSGRLYFHMVAALAEFEADIISERTKAGLTAARARGRVGGRPSAVTPEKMELANELLAKRDPDTKQPLHSVADVAALLGVSTSSMYRALKRPPTK